MDSVKESWKRSKLLIVMSIPNDNKKTAFRGKNKKKSY